MDDPAQPLRDYHDLTRKELIARLKHVKVLYTQVSFTHENPSPRVIQAFGLAVLMLIVMFSLTDSMLIAVLVCLVTLLGVLRYSSLPMDWRSQLNTGITRMKLLRCSPLHQFTCEPNAPWEYAQYCLQKEIHLIYVELQSQSEPFTA